MPAADGADRRPHAGRCGARASRTAKRCVCGDGALDYCRVRGRVAGLRAELTPRCRPGSAWRWCWATRSTSGSRPSAVQAAGAQVVPLNPDYTAQRAGADPADADRAGVDPRRDAGPMLRGAGRHARIRALAGGRRRARRLHRLAPSRDSPGACRCRAATMLSTLQYTGGTTGRSKGVELTHRAVAVNVSQREALLPTRAGRERVLAITPLFHVYAIAMCLYLARLVPRLPGDPAALPSGPGAGRHRAGADHAVLRQPDHLQRPDGLRRRSRATDFLARVASPAPRRCPEMLRRWEAPPARRSVEGYGQTEAGPVLASTRPRRRSPARSACRCRARDFASSSRDGRRLPVGEIGEICASGPELMRGYRNLPAQTAEALRDGGCTPATSAGWTPTAI